MRTIRLMREAMEFAGELFEAGAADELYAFSVAQVAEQGRLSLQGDRAKAYLVKADAEIKRLNGELTKANDSTLAAIRRFTAAEAARDELAADVESLHALAVDARTGTPDADVRLVHRATPGGGWWLVWWPELVSPCLVLCDGTETGLRPDGTWTPLVFGVPCAWPTAPTPTEVP